MSVRYFDRDGDLIKFSEWCELLESDGYRRVARDEVDGNVISTVWLGLDVSAGLGPPLIFETMIFAVGSFVDLDQRRYSTEREARAGHEEAVLLVRATTKGRRS